MATYHTYWLAEQGYREKVHGLQKHYFYKVPLTTPTKNLPGVICLIISVVQLPRLQTSNVTHLVWQCFAVDPYEHSLPHVLPAPLQGHPLFVFAVRFVEQVLLHLHEMWFSWKISRGDSNLLIILLDGMWMKSTNSYKKPYQHRRKLTTTDSVASSEIMISCL